ncbi:hypothetical protein FA15DRAFT_586294 [Coprinopsis marcescibilis]|uniref:Uncharacterized protein n=1 Tax=Coprinopsis marcescibilis TaxID=230819 RepID=A0A5C3L3E0_COPMA|nr:hypothetical protein FA15DRAFT_586294 [Coprinopsis marcescibilis]
MFGTFTIIHGNLRLTSPFHTIRSFPHVTNLTCKAVISAITNIELASVNDDCVDLATEIRVSSLRWGLFAALQHAKSLNDSPLELLHDVDTRWSSTLLMIKRFVKLKEFVLQMISKYNDLVKYKLTNNEWKHLNDYISILQQKLSGERTPTLHQALPLFYQMILRWKKYKHTFPDLRNVLDAGISKLEDYLHDTETVPAYALVMSTPVAHISTLD